MKASDTYKPLRQGLKPVLNSLGFSRVKSSPPSYAKPGGHGHVCLWFKVRSAGWDYALGGEFVGALQSGFDANPGIEWMAGKFASSRIWRLLDNSSRTAAVKIHNSIVSKFSHPPEDHWLYTLDSAVVASTLDDLKPLVLAPSIEAGFWFRYFDSDDVLKWAHFLCEYLPEITNRFECSLPDVES